MNGPGNSLRERLARNADPMKKKRLWLKAFGAAFALGVPGLFLLIFCGSEFLVFGVVLLAAALFALADGIATKRRR